MHTTRYSRFPTVNYPIATLYLSWRALLWTALSVGFLLICTGCGLLGNPLNAANRAEELTQQGRYDEAISLYQAHIQNRLSVSNREQWENPHFYLLRIGDLYLRLEKPELALQAYQEAEKNQIEDSLISDRYRAVAHWYIEHDQLQSALDLLTTYRDRDSLLFDAMLDRVARALTQQETALRSK